MRRHTPWIVLAAALLSACGGMARRDSQPSLERYMQYAGPPIRRFRIRNTYHGWQSVGDYPLVMFAGHDAYLLSVVPPCAQLQLALNLRLSTAIPGSVSRLDYVAFDGQRCLIDEIRPIHQRKMQHDAARQRQQAQTSG